MGGLADVNQFAAAAGGRWWRRRSMHWTATRNYDVPHVCVRPAPGARRPPRDRPRSAAPTDSLKRLQSLGTARRRLLDVMFQLASLSFSAPTWCI